jgi:cyclin B
MCYVQGYQTVFCDDCRDCAKILVTSHSTAPESKLKVVYKKYTSEKLGGVALRPPATEICK